MNNVAVYFPAEQAVSRIIEPTLRVEVAGRWRPSLRVVGYEQRAGDVPRVELALDVGSELDGSSRWLVESSLRAIEPTDLVTVDVVRGGTMGWRSLESIRVFEGYIDGPAFSYSGRADAATFRAADRSEALLSQRVSGQWADDGSGGAMWMGGLELVFNPDGVANMSASDWSPQTGARPRRIFVAPGSPGAEPWTADEAANYLLAFYAAADWLALPSAVELTRIVGSEVLEDVRVEGRTVMDALESLVRRVGLRATVALGREPGGKLTRSLVLVGRGLGRQVSLYHQMPGEAVTPTKTAMERIAAEIEWSESLASLELAGDVKVYESTFDLVPGWDPALEGEDRAKYRRSDNADFPLYADVYRKWVLNEAGQYTDEPFDAGPAYDLSDLFEGAPTLRRRRRFLPTVSTDATGESWGVYVEASYDGGAVWQRYGGPVRVLRDECGVYLSSDQLPAGVFHAAERDELAVRVTASVESDARLGVVVERPGLADDHRGRRLWRDVAREYRYRKVSEESRFHGGSSNAADDSWRLAKLAADLWAADHWAPTPCRVGLPFFSVSYRVGDEIDAIRYRWAWLRRSAGGMETRPLVAAVRGTWDGEGGWRTELELE